MKVIYNKLIPVKGFSAINLLGVVFARKEYKPLSEKTLNHESIHTRQMKEMLYIGFYVWYAIEWTLRFILELSLLNDISDAKRYAYRDISFEAEAYSNQWNFKYLETRKSWSFLKYF